MPCDRLIQWHCTHVDLQGQKLFTMFNFGHVACPESGLLTAPVAQVLFFFLFKIWTFQASEYCKEMLQP